MTDQQPEFIRLCTNPLCERVVPASSGGERQVTYCCAQCANAHQRVYEIHESGPLAHSEGCDERWAERKDRWVRYAR